MEARQMESNSMRYPHVAARVFNTPLLIEPGKLNAILGVLAPRMGFEAPNAIELPQLNYARPDAHVDYMLALGAELETKRMDAGYYLVNGHIAVIPVIGSLVQRSDFMSDMSGMTSYASLSSMFNAAMNDPNVSEILLELDTPGGEVAGAFDFADSIFNAREGGKLITAAASEQAASAGYLIASAAHQIIVPRTGSVGSVGVVAAHMDQSKAMEKKGVAVTLIYAGEKKVDGNPYQPLPASVKAEWQAEIQDVYGLFVDTVARNLNIGADRVRGTQAAMFMGSKAVDAGLAHRVNTFSNELRNATLRKRSYGGTYRLGLPERQEDCEVMDKAEATKGGITLTAEDVSKARAEGHAAGVAEAQAASASAVKEAVTAERARISAIVQHEEAAGRSDLAAHLAFSTDSTVEAAASVLKAAPKAEPVKKGSALDRAMEGAKPNVPSQEVVAGSKPASLDANAIFAKRAAQVAAARK
jgi:ClpP class serine protease